MKKFTIVDVIDRINKTFSENDMSARINTRINNLCCYTSALRGFDGETYPQIFKIIFTGFIRGATHNGIDQQYLKNCLRQNINEVLIKMMVETGTAYRNTKLGAFTHFTEHIIEAFDILQRMDFITSEMKDKAEDALQYIRLNTPEKPDEIEKWKGMINKYLDELRGYFRLKMWDKDVRCKDCESEMYYSELVDTKGCPHCGANFDGWCIQLKEVDKSKPDKKPDHLQLIETIEANEDRY